MSWGWHMGVSQKHDVFDQFISAENERQRLLKSDDLDSLKQPHPEAIYKSRLLNFSDLPKPVNRSSYLKVSTERSSFSFISGDDDSREISFPVSDEDLAISINNF
ncbi:5297_t:CDS:2 [Cetraspora pellucida]|uniref:5297_t:CDS:1 n=1 Tax=Cetraspora pellucida TaxID=1433469 RepID=A0ACA9LB39_9GLOM|nr:5297_t:CDS:2 [Cetraspora pellucida]